MDITEKVVKYGKLLREHLYRNYLVKWKANKHQSFFFSNTYDRVMKYYYSAAWNMKCSVKYLINKTYESKYSRLDQVKFVENTQQTISLQVF